MLKLVKQLKNHVENVNRGNEAVCFRSPKTKKVDAHAASGSDDTSVDRAKKFQPKDS
jgi:hypothetical protein